MPSMTIGVIGGSTASVEQCEMAQAVGRQIALKGAVLVCGGKGGIMEAASRGAHEADGVVVGILPSLDKRDANRFVTVAVPTGMGLARNTLVVNSSDVLIAFAGSYGTLSEMAFALNSGKTVVAMPGAWELGRAGEVDRARFKEAHTPEQAVGLALGAIAQV